MRSNRVAQDPAREPSEPGLKPPAASAGAAGPATSPAPRAIAPPHHRAEPAARTGSGAGSPPSAAGDVREAATGAAPSVRPTCWGWQLVFKRPEPGGEEGSKDPCAGVIAKVTSVGLTTRRETSVDGTHEFVQIGCRVEQLYAFAERMRINMPLRDFGHMKRWDAFRLDNIEAYGREADGELFNASDRVRILREFIETPTREGGAGLDFTSSRRDEAIVDAFPVHDPSSVALLSRVWVRASLCSLTQLPLDDVQAYFGAEVGMYFAFLANYTRWLVVPALGGTAVAISQLFSRYDSIAVPAFCVLLMLWVTVWLEHWKRAVNFYSYQWGLVELRDPDEERVEFKCKERVGAYIQGVFVALDDVAAAIPEGPQRSYFNLLHTVGWYPKWRRKLRALLASPIVFFFLGVVVIATISIMILRIVITRARVWGGTFWAGIVNSVIIFILNQVYSRVAIALNRFENHRTEEEFEQHLVNKVFAFQFVNSYCSLYYIAFFKDSTLLGTYRDSCVSNDCLADLAVQLMAIMTTRQLIGSIIEFVLPWIATRIGALCCCKEQMLLDSQDQEREYYRAVFERTISEYSELVIQFGYVVLFAAAFPLAALFALLNNLIELRADAFVILHAYRRPVPLHSSVIQTQWDWILKGLSYAAVLTNCALMMWTSRSLGRSFELSSYGTLLLIVVVEHLVLALKLAIAYIIPDTPSVIVRNTLQREFEKTLAWEKMFDVDRTRLKHTDAEWSDSSSQPGSPRRTRQLRPVAGPGAAGVGVRKPIADSSIAPPPPPAPPPALPLSMNRRRRYQELDDGFVVPTAAAEPAATEAVAAAPLDL